MAGAALSPANAQALSARPTRDLGLTFTTTAYGVLVVEIPLTAVYDWLTVAGLDRLLMEFTRDLFIAVGQDFLTFERGSLFPGDLGTPLASDPGVYAAQFDAFVVDFMKLQSVEATRGFYAPDELLDHVENLTVIIDPQHVLVTINAVLVAQSGGNVLFNQTIGS